jgi:hypothetical protein
MGDARSTGRHGLAWAGGRPCQVTVTAEGLVFSGEVSLANNGGFASIRARLGEYDLAGATARPTRSPFRLLIPFRGGADRQCQRRRR